MLDLKLVDVRKLSLRRFAALSAMNVKVTEKFDGVKCTLYRNTKPFDPNDCASNWVISYKSNIISPFEFDGIENFEQVHNESIGTSQWSLVYRHLQRAHQFCKTIPCDTEFFVEFVMKKPTLTRDYETTGSMFLLGYATNVHPIINQFRFTSPNKLFETARLDEFAMKLNLQRPPILHEGSIGDIANFMTRFDKLRSCLGGIAEGIVIETKAGERFKLVVADQYDKMVRTEKKDRWRLEALAETEYWANIKRKAEFRVRETITNCIDSFKWLSHISKSCYGFTVDIENACKTTLQIQDDLFLTCKIALEREVAILNSEGNRIDSLGVFVMAGKPIHQGHWAIIKKAARECEGIVVFVSTGDRDGISGDKMLRVWEFLLPHLPANVMVRFCASPFIEAQRNLEVWIEKLGSKAVTVYCGDETERWSLAGCAVQTSSRALIPISGTELRNALKIGDRAKFVNGLPEVLSSTERDLYWELLTHND